jgi:triosephosphate isomerase
MPRFAATAAHRAGLLAIVCVGETRAEREAGRPRLWSRPSSTARCPMLQARLVVATAGLGDRRLTPTPGDVARCIA